MVLLSSSCSSLETRLLIRIKPAIFFSISLSDVRPGTRFDLTCDPFGRTKKRRENNMFHCNKITLEVSSQLFNEDHATSVLKLAEVVGCLRLT